MVVANWKWVGSSAMEIVSSFEVGDGFIVVAKTGMPAVAVRSRVRIIAFKINGMLFKHISP